MQLVSDPCQLVLIFGFASVLAFFVMKLSTVDSLYVAGLAAISSIMATNACDLLVGALYEPQTENQQQNEQ